MDVSGKPMASGSSHSNKPWPLVEKNGRPDTRPKKRPPQRLLRLKIVPMRQYLKQAIVPHLIRALTVLSNDRPEEPIEFLAAYLLRNKHVKPKIWKRKRSEKPRKNPI